VGSSIDLEFSWSDEGHGLVDEIQYAKGHKYLTLVYQIDLGIPRLLWVGKERTSSGFRGFFTAIGEEVTSKIAFVCSDIWEPYLKVIREKCTEALHILDRFHIVAKMNQALDEVAPRKRAGCGSRVWTRSRGSLAGSYSDARKTSETNSVSGCATFFAIT
jgi:transposase